MMFSDSFQAVLFTHFAQVSIVALCACLAWRLLAQDRPHLAHAIWALVLIKCLAPPIIGSPISPFSWFQNTGEQRALGVTQQGHVALSTTRVEPMVVDLPALETNESTAIAATAPESRRRINWKKHQRYLHFYSWGVVSVAGLLFIAVRYVRFVRGVRKQKVVPNATAEMVMKRLTRQLKIRRKVRLLIIDGPIGPAVLGILRPAILMPAIITQGKTAEELEPLIAHELIHIRRGDLWWSWLQSIAKSLWWFHPLVWISGRMLTHEAERCCDEETVSSLGCAPSSYARSLLDVLEQKHRLRSAPALPGVRPVDVTSRRIERIMRLGQGSHRRSPRWIWLFMAIAAICILPGAALVVAQDSRPHSAPPQLTPSNLPAYAESGDEYSVRIYHVSDQLATIMRDGLDEQQAGKELLQLLPSTAAAQTVEHVTYASPVPARPTTTMPASWAPPPPSEHETTRVLQDGRLIVNTNARTHDLIREALNHYHDSGFHQVKIRMTVMEVSEDKLPALTAANLIGAAIQSDAGIEGELLVEDLNQPDNRVVQVAATRQQASVFSPPMESSEIDAWVRSLREQGMATVLSIPTILTTNGRMASIHIGSAAPVHVRRKNDNSPSAAGEAAGQVQTGFKSLVVPRLRDDGEIELDIQLEVTADEGSRIRSSTTTPDGKTFLFDAPVVSKSMVKTRVKCKLDTPLLIAGPLQMSRQEDQDGEQKEARKRIMVLLTCHAISPFAQQEEPQLSPDDAADKGQDEAETESSGQVASKKGVEFRNGNCTLQIRGDVSVQTQGDLVTVTGTDIALRVGVPHITHQEDWPTMRGDEGRVSFNLGIAEDSGDDLFDTLEARLHGNAMITLNSEERIQAKTIDFKAGSVIAAADVIVEMEEMKLRADQLLIDSKTRIAKAHGNVLLLRDGNGALKTNSLQWDMKTGRITGEHFELIENDSER